MLLSQIATCKQEKEKEEDQSIFDLTCIQLESVSDHIDTHTINIPQSLVGSKLKVKNVLCTQNDCCTRKLDI